MHYYLTRAHNLDHLPTMLRFYTAWLAAFVLLLAACNANPAPPTPQGEPAIKLEPCLLSAPGIPGQVRAECGKLSVFEDRAAGAGRMIELNLAVVPAVSRSPAPDPLFFLTGGPGQAATESYPLMSEAFNRINQKREIVLVDQRGAGKSNPLACEEMEQEPEPGEDLAPWLLACLAKIDGSPALYTTPIAMEDLDQVRAALGYEKINLYGVSYGTRAALTYLRQYPQRVRAVILDGVVPQDEALGIDVARDAQRALNMIFERCADDSACTQAFPNLDASFEALLASLDARPVEVSLPHPTSGEMETLTFTREMMGSAVRLLSYAPETAALLPLLIHTAHARQDFSLLAAQYLIVAGQLEESISSGMGYSVLCAEDLPFIDWEEAERRNAGSYLGNQETDLLYKVCQVWPRGDIPAGFKEPVQSEVPVLLLSGDSDPVTPPENAEEAARTLPNSLHVVVPGQGHNVVFRGCVPRLSTAFIEAGSVQGLDTSCADQFQPAPFFINFSGPNP